MSITQAILVGVLTAVGAYLLMHRTLVRIILGVAMLGNAVNLLIVSAGGAPGRVPIVDVDGSFPERVSDPLPQALVLTAIVIGFAMVSFLLSIAYRSWTIDGNDEVEDDISDLLLLDAPVDDLEDSGEES